MQVASIYLPVTHMITKFHAQDLVAFVVSGWVSGIYHPLKQQTYA